MINYLLHNLKMYSKMMSAFSASLFYHRKKAWWSYCARHTQIRAGEELLRFAKGILWWQTERHILSVTQSVSFHWWVTVCLWYLRKHTGMCYWASLRCQQRLLLFVRLFVSICPECYVRLTFYDISFGKVHTLNNWLNVCRTYLLPLRPMMF